MKLVTATDVIALYAAVVSTVAFGWKLTEYLLRRRTRVRVVLEHAFVPVTESSGDQFDASAEPCGYTVRVVAINDGDTTEYVNNGTLVVPGGGGVGRAINEVLRPRHSVSTEFWEAQFPTGFDGGFRGEVVLASGKTFTSDLEFPDSVLRDIRVDPIIESARCDPSLG